MDRAQRHLAAFDGGQNSLEKERVVFTAVPDELALLRLLKGDFGEGIGFELGQAFNSPAYLRWDQQADFDGESLPDIDLPAGNLAFHKRHRSWLLRGILSGIQHAQDDGLGFIALPFYLHWDRWN